MKDKLSPKVKALYEAVLELIGENVDIRDVKVSDITGRAGIGKGTAYEYFSNKEEIIGSALLYHIDLICSQVMESISKIDDFSTMIRYILVCMDEEIQKMDCLIQFIHLLTDNGPISKLLRREIRENNSKVCMPQDLIDQMIQTGIRQGDIKAQMPSLYMRMTIMSKLLVYALYITEERVVEAYDKQQIHQFLCEGLLKELN